jgi:hypothetical protein
MESNLLESVPIIVDTVMMPTTGDQDGDDQSGGGNSSSTASPVPITQDESDNIEITDEVVHILRTVTPTILSVSCSIRFVITVGIMES